MTLIWSERGPSCSRAGAVAIDIKIVIMDAAPLITLASATTNEWPQ